MCIFKYKPGNKAVTCTAHYGLPTPKSKQWQCWFYRINAYLQIEYYKLLMYNAVYFHYFLCTDTFGVGTLVGEIITMEN